MKNSSGGDVPQESYDEETNEVTIEGGEGEQYENITFQLWRYNNNVFEDILVAGGIDKEPIADYSSKIANMDWYAVRKDDVITVFEKKTNKTWTWDASKERLVASK